MKKCTARIVEFSIGIVTPASQLLVCGNTTTVIGPSRNLCEGLIRHSRYLTVTVVAPAVSNIIRIYTAIMPIPCRNLHKRYIWRCASSRTIMPPTMDQSFCVYRTVVRFSRGYLNKGTTWRSALTRIIRTPTLNRATAVNGTTVMWSN